MPEWINVIVAALLSGFFSAIVVEWIRNRTAKNAAKAAIIREQLQKVYGPISFYIALSKAEIDSYDNFPTSIENDCSDENIAHDVVKSITQYTDKIIDLLCENYAFIDPDDMLIFEKLASDNAHIANWKEQIPWLPSEVIDRIKGSTITHPELVKRIKQKFEEKQKALAKLQG